MKDKHEVLLSSDNTGLDIKYKSILSPFIQGNPKYLIEILTLFCYPVISGIFTFLWQGDDKIFFLIRLYVLISRLFSQWSYACFHFVTNQAF